MKSLKLLPRRIFAFVARDFRLYVSYRMQFFLRILSVLTVVTTLFLGGGGGVGTVRCSPGDRRCARAGTSGPIAISALAPV